MMVQKVKMKKRRHVMGMGSFGLLLILSIFLCGCATLGLTKGPVQFVNPYTRLSIVEQEPNEQEQEGLLLRLDLEAKGIVQSEEEITAFENIKDNEGVKAELKRIIMERIGPGSRKDSFNVYRIITFEDQPSEMIEEYEVSTRGEIVEFIQGYHKSRMGNIKILSLRRTPTFPEEKVQIGDTWKYNEVMNVKIESKFVKQKNSLPYTMSGTVEFIGIAMARGKRCAVLQTSATATRNEQLRILFKNLALQIQAEIEKVTYFDYQEGKVVAEITRTKTHTVNPDTGFNSRGRSQSIFYTFH